LFGRIQPKELTAPVTPRTQGPEYPPALDTNVKTIRSPKATGGAAVWFFFENCNVYLMSTGQSPVGNNLKKTFILW